MTDSSRALGQAGLESPGSEDLKLLKQGHISTDEYLERRLAIAVQGLGSALTEAQRSEILALLRDHFLDDPALRLYAARAEQSGKSE